MRLLRRSPPPAPYEEPAEAAEAELDGEPGPGAADGAHADPPTVELAALGGDAPEEGPGGAGSAGEPAEPPSEVAETAAEASAPVEPEDERSAAREPEGIADPPPPAGSAWASEPEPVYEPGPEPAAAFASAPTNGAGPGEHALAAVPYGEPPLWERPEVALAAAFCAGLIAAAIFKRR